MTIIVTGAAGFIGSHVCEVLLTRGEDVVGVDNVNDYYDVTLKEARLGRLQSKPGFRFERLDIADREAMGALPQRYPDTTGMIHLAAQAGVRYSLINPYAYTHANVEGQLVVMETCRRFGKLAHLVYASSSSVYGGNTKLPFSVEDRVDQPVSLYAASKRSAELLAQSYGHMYGLPASGLRFFTVYGPWGRPDMAAFIFTKAILAGQPIQVFNRGDMRRDFTYVDDIVAGVVACLDRPPAASGPKHRLYNLGNHRSENLLEFIAVLEEALGQKAKLELLPLQIGDVPDTFADIGTSRKDLGFSPKTTIREGLPRFVQWYRSYFAV
jgi:UDP-glucuronate 4-epimerase